MPNLSQLYLFAATSFVILIIPGPAVLYAVVQSIRQGRIAGMVAVLGLELGTVFHVIAAAGGISALLPSNTTLFNILRVLGTAYLIYIGIGKLLPSKKMQHKSVKQYESLKQIFWQGVMVELFNPKTILFFLAFLPQFVIPDSSDTALQVLIFGLLFVGLAIVIDLFYAILAGLVGNTVRGSRWFTKKQRYIESSIYIGLSIATALPS